MTHEGLDDDQLLEKIAGRNEAAFSALMERHLGPVRALCWRMLGDDGEADDVTQDVFCKIWQAPRAYVPGRAAFTTWLHKVTANRCIDRLRAKRPLPAQTADVAEDRAGRLTATGPDPERALGLSQTARTVQRALLGLPVRQRLAIVLGHYHGYGNSEIAHILGATVEAVEALLGRARRQLRGQLAGAMAEVTGRTPARETNTGNT